MLLALIMCYWFMISFMTNILAPLIPDIINNFQLKELLLAGFLPSSFFVAYAVMSIPAGMMVDRFGEKAVLLCGFGLPLLGSFLFASMAGYAMLLASSFIIGLGVAMLQTVMNPLQRRVGGERNYAFVAQMGQFVFGIGSLCTPLVYRFVLTHVAKEQGVQENPIIRLLDALTPPTLPWVSVYWIFVILLSLMILSVLLTRFPKVQAEGSSPVAGKTYLHLFSRPLVWMYFFGIFSYVATEQGVTNFMGTFLEKYHGVPAQTEGTAILHYYWITMVVGCGVGMLLLKLVDGKYILRAAALLGIVALALALWGSVEVAKVAFVSIGFCLSVMFSLVFSLALNSFEDHHGALAGVLCTGMAGGAVGPTLVSALSDLTGDMHIGMSLLFITLAYICFIGFKARPIVTNKRIGE